MVTALIPSWIPRATGLAAGSFCTSTHSWANTVCIFCPFQEWGGCKLHQSPNLGHDGGQASVGSEDKGTKISKMLIKKKYWKHETEGGTSRKTGVIRGPMKEILNLLCPTSGRPWSGKMLKNPCGFFQHFRLARKCSCGKGRCGYIQTFQEWVLPQCFLRGLREHQLWLPHLSGGHSQSKIFMLASQVLFNCSVVWRMN